MLVLHNHNEHTMQAHQMSHEGLMGDFRRFVITLGDNKHSHQKIRPSYMQSMSYLSHLLEFTTN